MPSSSEAELSLELKWEEPGPLSDCPVQPAPQQLHGTETEVSALWPNPGHHPFCECFIGTQHLMYCRWLLSHYKGRELTAHRAEGIYCLALYRKMCQLPD